MTNNWKTSLTGLLTGTVLLINSLALPLLNGDPSAIDWSGVATGLGALGLGWFARDKEDGDDNSGKSSPDDDYERWIKS